MAAAQEPQPNPYELHPHATPRAEPGHVHRFVARSVGERLKCIYCEAVEVFILRDEKRKLEARVRLLENGVRKIKSTPTRTGGFIAIHRICDELLPISEMATSTDDDKE